MIRKAQKASRRVVLAASAIGGLATGYFVWHAVGGDKGLGALSSLAGENAALAREAAGIRKEREALEHRAKLLRSGSLDPDMLEERARAVLNFSEPRDIVIPE